MEVDQYLKTGKFLKYKQENLAAYLIYKARKQLFEKGAWNQHL